jgi:Uma2 family endonuclease
MATVSKSPAVPILAQEIPPLENGDHLSRDEFERRYQSMPELKKAELIEGVTFVASPVRVIHHGRPHAHLIYWLVGYESVVPGVIAADNATVRLDSRNEPQPDVTLYIDPTKGGQVRISSDGYIKNAPELVAEVASSSVSIDAKIKLEVYRRAGVREYVLWRVRDNEIDWFVLNDGQYERLPQDASGFYRSQVFPGLWLDPAALIRGDIPAVREALGQGLATPEHQAFVERLQAVPNSTESANAQ